jgi:hypothetical protein
MREKETKVKEVDSTQKRVTKGSASGAWNPTGVAFSRDVRLQSIKPRKGLSHLTVPSQSPDGDASGERRGMELVHVVVGQRPRINTALLAWLASTKFHVKLHIRLSTQMAQEDSLRGAANPPKYITVSFQAVTPVRLSCVTALHIGAELIVFFERCSSAIHQAA